MHGKHTEAGFALHCSTLTWRGADLDLPCAEHRTGLEPGRRRGRGQGGNVTQPWVGHAPHWYDEALEGLLRRQPVPRASPASCSAQGSRPRRRHALSQRLAPTRVACCPAGEGGRAHLASPKSPILAVPLRLSSTLPGFRSLRVAGRGGCGAGGWHPALISHNPQVVHVGPRRGSRPNAVQRQLSTARRPSHAHAYLWMTVG